MYAAYFGLREPPFALTPDPAYVYLSRHHREGLAHLLYGTNENCLLYTSDAADE
mgnify:CR=1 FL=1